MCSHSFRKPVCLRGMTSSRLRTKVYDAVREKTIFPLVTRRRQTSMDHVKVNEEATTSADSKIPVLTYNKDEEKENTCSPQRSGDPAVQNMPVMVSVESSSTVVLEEELDAGVVPVMSESARATSEPLVYVTSQNSTPMVTHMPAPQPTASHSTSPATPVAKAFKIHDNAFETMRAQEQIQGQGHSSESSTISPVHYCSPSHINTSFGTSPRLDSQASAIVPRKRGRPKGSTTKNRKIKALNGLNLWGPKSTQSKLSTLELLALSAQQQQQVSSQQNESQMMAAIMIQQQHLQQQMMNGSPEALQLLLACDAGLQQMYAEQQHALLTQQQMMLGVQNESKPPSSQGNTLLEMQLQHEISNLEKILQVHAADQQKQAEAKISQTMDLGLYQLSNMSRQTNIVQSNMSSVNPPPVLKLNPPPVLQLNPPPVLQLNPPLMSNQFSPSASSALQKEAQQNALLHETMMKLQGQSLHSSVAHMSPNSIFSTASNGHHHNVPHNSTVQNHGIAFSTTLPQTVWSSPIPMDSIQRTTPVQRTNVQTISSPAVPTTAQHRSPPVSGKGGDVSDEVAKQFLELIKSLGNDQAQTEQLLHLLIGQAPSSNPAPQPAAPVSVSLPLSQTHPQSSFPQNLQNQSVTTSTSQPLVQAVTTSASQPLVQAAQSTTLSSSPTKPEPLAKMSDLEQLISSLKSPNQQKTTKPFYTPKTNSAMQLDHLLPKTRGRPPGTSNGSANTLKQTEGKRHRGRPRKYPEHFYNVVNGKMKYPGAKERRMFFPFEEGKYNNNNSPASVTQLHQSNGNPYSPASTSTTETTPQSETLCDLSAPSVPTDTPTPPPVPAKKRGRPKGSKNKPCLVTSPQQLLDLRPQYPDNSPIWAGMPDCKQSQIAAVLSGLNHKLFRQSTSFTV